MHEKKVSAVTAHRVAVFSDAVIAVIMTVMVLELKAPDNPALSALWPLWPTIVSYAVSYLFIAIIWINHHYLMWLVGPPTLRLIWINFAHLFMVSVPVPLRAMPPVDLVLVSHDHYDHLDDQALV